MLVVSWRHISRDRKYKAQQTRNDIDPHIPKMNNLSIRRNVHFILSISKSTTTWIFARYLRRIVEQETETKRAESSFFQLKKLFE